MCFSYCLTLYLYVDAGILHLRAASLPVISPDFHLVYTSGKLGGNSFLGLPKTTPFSFAAAIPSACLCFIKVRSVSATYDKICNTKSEISKQRFKSDEKNILIFKDVHEPIISREDFERAKEKRGKSKVRKKADGSKNIFSGLLECGGCGSNLNYHFAQNNPEREYFNCANYNNGRGCDNPHHIRMDFLTAAVLKSINSLTFFAQENDEYFEKYIQEKSNAANNEEINSLRSEVRDIEYRINKIDNIIANLYEDNLDGKISDERFASMTRKYETEQIELRNNFEIKNRKLIKLENKDSDCKSFMETVKKYTKPIELTRSMLCELIEKIVVFPAEKTNGVSVQRLNIYYRCIGSFEFDELGPEPEWNILIETRPGVILTDTTDTVE